MSSANLNHFDCSTLATEEAVVDGGLDMIKSFMEEFGEEATFDTEWVDWHVVWLTLFYCDRCINIAVKKNYFELAQLLVQEYYSKDPHRATGKYIWDDLNIFGLI